MVGTLKSMRTNRVNTAGFTILTGILALLLLFFVPNVRAECYPKDFVGPLPPGGTRDCAYVPSPIHATSVPALVKNTVDTILGVVGAAALGMFVYGGLVMMTSAGNSQRIEKGKTTLIWATVGLVAIFTSYGVLQIILKALSGG